MACYPFFRRPAFALAATLTLCAGGALASTPLCRAESPAALVAVIELYTSEGCSSCPPADRWLSTLKPSAAAGRAVVQAFHVGYWDHIGWADRFAAPAHTKRQRQVAGRNGLDWRDWGRSPDSQAPARARIVLQRNGDDAFEALVTPADGVTAWSAYWTVTEHGHSSKVKSGENAGEFLQHDFVVRQYVPAGDYRAGARLTLRTVPAAAGHPRQVNLVVVDPATGRPLQALSLGC
jgi:hypothetical protein